MSLTGNLEDLPLLDILQIVSFSQKTGYLAIRSADGEGAIVFSSGRIVASFTWDTTPLDPRASSLPAEQREKLIRKRIELALEQLIRLREGEFVFNLTDEPPRTIGKRGLEEETLSYGINAQEVLIDLARGIDEDRRDSTAALEASFAQPADPPADESTVVLRIDDLGPLGAPEGSAPAGMPSDPAGAAEEGPVVEPPAAAAHAPAEESAAALPPPPAAPPNEELRTLLLVDDEPDVRQILSEHFTAGGFQVVEAEDPDSAVKKAGRLTKAGIPFLVITDLGMPTSGGSSFHGGFEVVKRLWKMNLRPQILMMTESLGPSLQSRARQMGISHFVFKPGLSKLDPEQFEADLKAFAGTILKGILPRMLQRAAQAPPAVQPARPAAAVAEPAAADASRELAILHQRLEELRRQGDPTQISALVMRVAREFFERAVLFLVKNEEVRGLGAYGPAPRDESLNLLVREIVVPLSEPSVFLDAVTGRKPYTGPIPEAKWSRFLAGQIGRFRADEMALFPLLAHRETIALLYGDNPDTGRPFGRLDGLDVFINQAGIALENAFLQRKLQAMQGGGS